MGRGRGILSMILSRNFVCDITVKLSNIYRLLPFISIPFKEDICGKKVKLRPFWKFAHTKISICLYWIKIKAFSNCVPVDVVTFWDITKTWKKLVHFLQRLCAYGCFFLHIPTGCLTKPENAFFSDSWICVIFCSKIVSKF